MLVLRLFVRSFPKFVILYSATSVKSLLYNVGSHFWLYFASHVLKMWLLETLVIKHQIRISIGRNCMENALTSNVHNVSFWPIMSTTYKEENYSGYIYIYIYIYIYANSPLNRILLSLRWELFDSHYIYLIIHISHLSFSNLQIIWIIL